MLRITLRIVCLLVGLYCAIGARTTSASSTSAPPSGGDQQYVLAVARLARGPGRVRQPVHART